MKTLFDSLVRTFVPIVVGAVIGGFVTAGIELDAGFEPALIVAVTAAFQGVYYLVVRLFEKYVSPKFGWLLGLAKTPEYNAPSKDEVLARLEPLTDSEREASIQFAAARVNKGA
ncbi:hypothetical protein [Microbacterium sp. W4I20]|uniref:hypothetical protein n=1 Tax=Microbacterium sp. W4I20 TaxID=3042262 RepID=UPI002784BC3E|nr:hypothetical protein [Microbacterium sp. W4I20]MDQ0726796.1 flagellar motor component MotA [Microbacterium sp. W4I20]